MCDASQFAYDPGMAKSLTFDALTPTLPLQIADRIGAGIVEEQFRPGERLKETELATSFGVSRASVREALRILENRGLVQILPQRGAQVTLLSGEELDNLFEIRAALLALASRQAAERHTPASGPLLQAALKALESSVAEPRAYVRASAAMVGQIGQLSGNQQLAEMIASFAQRIGRYTRLGLATPGRRTQSLNSWKKLVRAIAARDGDLAERTHRRLALQNRDAALEEIRRRADAAPRPRGASGRLPT